MTKRQYRRIGGDEGRILADVRGGGWHSMLAITSAICAVDKSIARELLLNIVAAQSYERIAKQQGYVPLNRADFYGCRRKVLSLYAMMKNIE